MADVVELPVKLTVEGLDSAVKGMEALAVAVERANDALDRLGGHEHGGITVKVVGSLALVEIKASEAA